MREISLTQGKTAIVDDGDYEYMSQFKWCAILYGTTWYAARRQGRRSVFMHRVIAQAPTGIQVDHRDHDGLNNRRKNLRLATVAQNQRNVGPQRNNKSGYKGVSSASRTTRDGIPRWVAQIDDGGTRKHIGTYRSPIEAAKAYDAKACELFREFAWLNFPPEAGNDNQQNCAYE